MTKKKKKKEKKKRKRKRIGFQRLTFGHGRQHEQVHEERASFSAHQRDVARRAAEGSDVVLDPVQGGNLIHEAQIEAARARRQLGQKSCARDFRGSRNRIGAPIFPRFQFSVFGFPFFGFPFPSPFELVGLTSVVVRESIRISFLGAGAPKRVAERPAAVTWPERAHN